MNIALVLAYLFFIGSLFGWALEVFYRRFFSKNNPERKWINPGFCVGPYLPIYGTGLAVLFSMAYIADYYGIEKWKMFIGMALMMTIIEYVGGLFFLKAMNLRLWDYSKEWGNIQGLICPLFSAFWAILGAAYYFCIHDYVLDGLIWLSENLAFSFFIGFFFGVFVIDVVYSSHIVTKLKNFAKENELVANIEYVKAIINVVNEELEEHNSFFLPFSSKFNLNERLLERKENFEKKIKK